MKRICAWCKKPIGEVNPETDAEHIITHGLCKDCAFHLEAQKGMPLRKFLEGLGAAILVVDADGKVLAVNRQTQALVGKDLSAIEGRLCGEVFECEHSLLPEGCGRTVHCLGCAIRKAVTETYSTGRSCHKVPAHISRVSSGAPAEIFFLISTEKAGEVVLLRIDPVRDQTQ